MRTIPWCTPGELAKMSDRQMDDLAHFNIETGELETPAEATEEGSSPQRTPLQQFQQFMAVTRLVKMPIGAALAEWRAKRGEVPPGAVIPDGQSKTTRGRRPGKSG